MNIAVFQVCTVCLLIFFTLLELVEMLLKQRRMDGRKAALWMVRAKRIGTAKKNFRTRLLTFGGRAQEAELGEDRYLAGNRMTDDLYLDVSGKRVRLYINVQSDRLFLTVIQGAVHIEYHTYEADQGKRIEIPDRTKVIVSDLELEFIRKKVA